jgi:hypothetical protein
MRMNHKQEQLVRELFDKVKNKYPEIILKNLSVCPDDQDNIWVNILADMDEDREIELMHYCSTLECEIEENYGYAISIMPENPSLVPV